MGRTIDLSFEGKSYRFRVYRSGPRTYRVVVDGSKLDVSVDRIGELERTLRSGSEHFHVVTQRDGSRYILQIEGVPFNIERENLEIVRSPVPGVVVTVPVEVGDAVEVGQTVAVLEAMKMVTTIASPFAGTVSAVLTVPNQQVGAGEALARLAPAERGKPTEDRRIDFDSIAKAQPHPTEECSRALASLRALVSGYDLEPSDAARLGSRYSHACGSPDDQEAVREEEEDILTLFADVHSLSRGRPLSEEPWEEQVHGGREDLLQYLRTYDADNESLSRSFRASLRRALLHQGIRGLGRSADLDSALFRIYKSIMRLDEQIGPISAVLERRLRSAGGTGREGERRLRAVLDRIVDATRRTQPAIHDLATEVRYRYFDQPVLEKVRNAIYEDVDEHLRHITQNSDPGEREKRMRALVDCPQPLRGPFTYRFAAASAAVCDAMLEALVRRHYRIRALESVMLTGPPGARVATARYTHDGSSIVVLDAFAMYEGLDEALLRLAETARSIDPLNETVADLFVWRGEGTFDPDAESERISKLLERSGFDRPPRRVVVVVSGPGYAGRPFSEHLTFRHRSGRYVEERDGRGMHPMLAKRLGLWRLSNFRIERLPSAEDVYLFHCVGRGNERDDRLVALAEVRDLTPVRDDGGRVIGLPLLERMLTEALAGIRAFQSRRSPTTRLHWNRVLLYVWPTADLDPDEIVDIVYKLAPLTEGLGLEQVEVRARVRENGKFVDKTLRASSSAGSGLTIELTEPDDSPIQPLPEYEQKVVRMRRRGLVYPYEIVKLMTPSVTGRGAALPPGTFTELDLDDSGHLVEVDRPYGQNAANVVVGVVSTESEAYEDGMRRVILLGDPSHALGSLAEPECKRIIAALDLAEQRGLSLEWFAVSAGAKISMDSGTENMDWIGAVLKRLIEFTQAGGEVNILVTGINVGAQPYWNAEATMLMHTRGILVMTADGAMVLTGKQALDYSGGISADDNFGIGGYDRVMGPNGQAQYWASNIEDACRILIRHYEHTYVAPGDRWPRHRVTSDPLDRDVRPFFHRYGGGSNFTEVGDLFSDESNPSRKEPFDIRSVMRAVGDQDDIPLERWPAWRDAENGVVWDVRLGGHPVCLLGIESRPVARRGPVPADGPRRWTSGTLFPQASKKIARALNAASGNRPVVVLANLSGFDGSPESMRNLQLEYGAEIGRAVVNFKGPIVFCVVSRYHGGAFVVFSQTLNVNLEIAAVEGSFASVIGGAPAAAAVFARDVDARTRADERVRALEEQLAEAEGPSKTQLRTELLQVTARVRSEMLGALADEFDRVHSVERAQEVGSVHHIIPAERLRPYLIEAVERGKEKESGSTH